MATNDISKHFKITVKNSNGSRTDTTITSDTQFANFAANTLIRNIDSGEQYRKNSSFSNVFDKTDTFSDYLLPNSITCGIDGQGGNAVTSITYTPSRVKGTITYTMDDFIKNGEFRVTSVDNGNSDWGFSSAYWDTANKTLNFVRTRYIQPSKVSVITQGAGNAVDSGSWRLNADGSCNILLNKGVEFVKKSELTTKIYENMYMVLSVAGYVRGAVYNASDLRGGSGYRVLESDVPAYGSYYCISSRNIDAGDLGVIMASQLGCTEGTGYYNRHLTIFVRKN